MAIVGKRSQLLGLVQTKAAQYKVDPKLLDAIIIVESAYNPWAVRFEQDFPHIAVPTVFAKNNRTTIATERMLQKFSWGLCQVMGGTARYLSYGGPLTQLVDPEINLTVACKFLANLANEYPVDVQDQIAAYNAGSARRVSGSAGMRYVNQDYVNKVVKAMKMITF